MVVIFLFLYIVNFICARELFKSNTPKSCKALGIMCMLLMSAAYDFTIILTQFVFLAAMGAALLIVLIIIDIKFADDTGENIQYTFCASMFNLLISILVLLTA